MSAAAKSIIEQLIERISSIEEKGDELTVDDARILIRDISSLTRLLMVSQGYTVRDVVRLTTKLRDAGRRSPPWTPHSARVPGRPQDGADGNRRLRWLFEVGHKFHADEVTATLVEVKYYLQILSMLNAPDLPSKSLQSKFRWLVKHPIIPGSYRDPIQLEVVDLRQIVADLRTLHSGHLVPLDRGGKHEPANTFLVMARSNQLQGNLTLSELLELMRRVVKRHDSGEADII